MKKLSIPLFLLVNLSLPTQSFAQEDVAQPKDCKGKQVYAGATYQFNDPQRFKVCKNDFGFQITVSSKRFGMVENTAMQEACKKTDGKAGKFTVRWSNGTSCY